MIFLRFKAPPCGDGDLDDLFLPNATVAVVFVIVVEERRGNITVKAAALAAATAAGIPKPAKNAPATPAAATLNAVPILEPPVMVVVCVFTTV